MSERPANPVPWFDDRHEGWRRIRVGIGGLAGILLLLALANAMLSRLGLVDANRVAATENAKGEATQSEPMADLGMAPGAAEPKAPTQGAPAN